jgi:hypothetical protein
MVRTGNYFVYFFHQEKDCVGIVSRDGKARGAEGALCRNELSPIDGQRRKNPP